MKVKKIAIYGTTAAIALATLTGCGEQTENVEELTITAPPTEEEIFKENVVTEQLSEEIKQGDSKVFEPYQHLFYVRFNLDKLTGLPDDITGGSIEIPTGYKVFEIENFNVANRYASQTGGYDVWFINEVPVEVNAVYNESLGKYDYSRFGVPIKTEKEESIQKTK